VLFGDDVVALAEPLSLLPQKPSRDVVEQVQSCLVLQAAAGLVVELSAEIVHFSADLLRSFQRKLALEARTLEPEVFGKTKEVSEKESIDAEPCLADPMSDREPEIAVPGFM
jgi:hypothetical protein